LSTNGLKLQESVEGIVEAGVKTVSVTVNATDPFILNKINAGVVFKGRKYIGAGAAELLIQRQIAGIREASGAGLVVKTNAVLIPGINDSHIEEIAEAVKDAGAGMINVIPLIPNAELSHVAAPDCELLNRVRAAAERHLPVFRHCRQCRADACGIPGVKDIADKLYDHRLETFSHG
jgi:nitrogen fixation protein NifB